MRKIFITLSLILTFITIFTGCSFANISLMETTTAEVVTLPDVTTTEVSITEENTTIAPAIETTTIEEITTAIQELVTNEYVTSAPETTTIAPETTIPETTTEVIMEIWKNDALNLSFNIGTEYKLYDATNINSFMDMSLFESIGFTPEMFVMNESGSKAAAVVTGSNSTFNSKFLVSAMKMATSFADGTKYTGSGKETINGETYDYVSMSVDTDTDTMHSDFLFKDKGNTLVMIMLMYNNSSSKTEIINCFN